MKISWRHSDYIEANLEGDSLILTAKGCSALIQQVQKINPIQKDNIQAVVTSLGSGHHDLLVREAILKACGEWNYPYQEEELCHCRAIATTKVDEAIVGGLHDAESIGKYCSAGITCGNCRVDIDNMLSYRLGSST